MKGKAKKRASGGAMKVAGNPNVFKEAEGRKRGGAVNGTAGVAAAAPTKTVGRMTGGAVRPRLDRPGRKSGGRVGADKSPLSSAHGTTGAGSTGGQPD